MRNISYDLCAMPIYALILLACVSRGLTRSRANRIFAMMNATSLAATSAEVVMELLTRQPPLSGAAVLWGTALSYVYFVARHVTLVLYLIFVFVITRTDYHIRPRRQRVLLWLPNALLNATLAQNLINHNVFTITAAGGYSRGPAMAVLYAIAAVYGLVGAAYCIRCRRYLTAGKWASLLSVYVLTASAVVVQMLRRELLVEMFSTSAGLLVIVLMVMRLDETLDSYVGLQSWQAYQTDLRNVLLSGVPAQLLIGRMANAQEIRSYLGDDQYSAYVREVADEIRSACCRSGVQAELYFERPGAFYLVMGGDVQIDEAKLRPFLEEARSRTRRYADMGAAFEPKFCAIRCPEDLSELRDVLNLGHKFWQFGGSDQLFFRASDIVKSRNFEIENRMEEILNRAVTGDSLMVYYQPVYSVAEGRFRSAEALARLDDSRYGMISPGAFIPAAEALGLIAPIGERVMELVFRFIAEHDLAALGLDHINVNLSVDQCMQSDLPERVRRLRERYGVDPARVVFEITETSFDGIGGSVEKNLRVLAAAGYGLALDDYGTGYSNIQRLTRLPLDVIKIDKSMVDDMFTPHGAVIMRNTVQMMQGIGKQLVVEGVETREAAEAVAAMGCEYIQGFYYARPMEEGAFLEALAR